MKRILTITTASIALTALAACGNDDTAYEDTAQTEPAEQQEQYAESGDTDMEEANAVGAGSTYGAAQADNMDGTSLTADQRAELETQLADADEPTIEYEGNIYLSDAALNARDLTGVEVIGQEGDSVASVDDIIVDASGQAQQVVLSSGGFLGLGDKQVTVAFNELTISHDEENDVRIISALSDAAIDTAAEFDNEMVAEDMILVSDILGAEVALGTPDDTASVYDVIMDENGATEYAVLSTGLGSERFVIPFSDLQPGDTDGTWMISMSPERLESESRIVYF